MDNKHVAVAICDDYIWCGFGTTEERAKNALIDEWNTFFCDEGEEVNEFDYKIQTLVWIDGSACPFEKL